MAFNQLCTASITSLSSANFWPRKCSFIGPNKWKSDGAKSGLYGGCFNTPNFRVRSVSTVCAAIWGWVLSWSNNTLFERCPRRFDRVAGFNSFTSMLLYWALVTVWPFSWKFKNIGPLSSQKIGQHDFPSGSLCLEFFVGWRQQVLPLHRLSLTLWFIMVHSGLVSYHNSMEKNISFTSMTVQMVLTNSLPCTLVIIGQLPWDPSATHFPIPEVIMDNTVCRTVTRWILRQFHQ